MRVKALEVWTYFFDNLFVGIYAVLCTCERENKKPIKFTTTSALHLEGV